jgi:trimeric autotransporter adhesin
MSPLRLRIWLLALVVVLVGCGGHGDIDIDDLDAGGDARRDVAADRRTDAPTDVRAADGGDVRVDGTDVRVDAPVDIRVDVRFDAPIDTRDVADTRADIVADTRVDTPVDMRVDLRVDTRVDTVADTRSDTADTRVDVPPDVPRDASTDPDVDAGCSSDNQCPPTAPHCNTNTGACVSRVAIAVTPANPSIAAGTTQQFAATVTYSDTSTGNVTGLATWLSSNTPVATMNPGTPGLANGVAPGISSITATFGGFVGGTQLTVTAATLRSIQVTPANVSSPLGTTRQFTATGTYSDNSTQDLTATAMWASSATNVATIAAGGLATTASVGSTVITATIGGLSGTVTFTVTAATLVSINVTPPNQTIATLTSQDFTARGLYTDNTTQNLTSQATWASSNPGVATLNGEIATGIAAGTTTISATFGGITGSTQLHVTGASLTSIVVTPPNPTAPVGFNVQLRATGNFSDNTTQDLTADVFWSSSDDLNASISNAGGSEGLASALRAGTSTMAATIAGITGSTLFTITTSPLTSIQVAPAAPSIALGTRQAFTATAHFMDGTTLDVTEQVSWSSSALGVATVSNAAGSRGLATSVSVGMATITAALSGANGSATLTVTPATLSSIAISPPNASTPVATPLQFTATGTYSDGTMQNITTLVTWNSSDQGVATISTAAGSEGLATPVATGMTTISATLDMISASTPLSVVP